MTTEAEARIACPTPNKYRYATLEAAENDRLRLGASRGRELVVHDTCPCGWVHLTTDREPTGIGSTPLTVDQIIMLPPDEFNILVRSEVRGDVHPDTAAALRDTRLGSAWATALKLFQSDLNLQKQQKGGDKSPAVVEWRGRIDRVVLRTSERAAEARNIRHLLEQRKRIEQGTLAAALRSDEELDNRILRQMAAELASEKLKRAHLEEFMRLLHAEYERFNIPPTPAMKRAVEWSADKETTE